MAHHESPPEREARLLAALNGDLEARASFFDERLRRALHTMARHERDRRGLRFPDADLDDIVQTVCMVVLERIPARPVVHAYGFLRIVSRNTLLDAMRRREQPWHSASDDEPDEAEPPDPKPLPDEQALARLSLEHVWNELLWRLTPRQQDIVTLRYLHDLEPREIAVALGTTPGTVSNALDRIHRRHLRPLLEAQTQGDSHDRT